MEQKKYLPYLWLQILMLFYSLSGIASKKAAAEPFLSWKWILLYGTVLVIMAVYSVCWQQILKKIPLTQAYLCKAMTIVWGVIWGAAVFHEQITRNKLIGGAMVIAGVLLVVSGGKQS